MSIKTCIIRIFKKYILAITSRQYIGRLLLKLPSKLFPNYRIVVSRALVDNNKELRLTIYGIESDSSPSSSSVEEEGFYVCCKYCQRLCYEYEENVIDIDCNLDDCYDMSSIKPARLSDVQENDIEAPEELQILDTPPLIVIKQSDLLSVQQHKPATEIITNIPKHKIEEGIFLTPPLRKISLQELTSVKLRKSIELPIVPRTPEVHDMLAALRRRYAVMHSPSFRKDSTSGSEWYE